LQINGKNAYHFMRGKHKHEVAELILTISRLGGTVLHIALRDADRFETELAEWAARINAG
jgi:hypothetical protein